MHSCSMRYVKFRESSKRSSLGQIKKLVLTWCNLYCSPAQDFQHSTLFYSTKCLTKQNIMLDLDRAPLVSSLARVYSTQKLSRTPVPGIQLFPQPIASMNIVSQRVQSKFGQSPIFKFKFRKSSQQFECELELNWPETKRFTELGTRKKIAQQKACLQALSWLYTNGLIRRDAQPIFNEIAKQRNTATINLSAAQIDKVDSVLDVYQRVVASVLKPFCDGSPNDSAVQCEKKLHPTLGVPFPTAEELEEWNGELIIEGRRNREYKPSLPIDDYRDAILDSLKSSRVIIIKGETGCGKTTRVPQFILDKSFQDGEGAYCNIAVTQPRRLTAIQIAKFVAQERGENVGGSVGFSVKMESTFPSVKGGSITFFTGQKLAQKFAYNPTLQGVSHVILDEVHMRDIGTDHVLTLLKRAMIANQNLQVIIMSATFDVDIFKTYFSSICEVPVIEVPGRTFPVKMHFLDDLPFKAESEGHEKSADEESDVNVDFILVKNVVSWINREKPEGAVLVFVTGMNDMLVLQELLSVEKNLMIIPVHSMFRDCSAAFKPAPKNMRKIILATNIAETSLTFPDVVYVVDCGLHKTSSRNMLSPGSWTTKGISMKWITKANLLQRRGRAGRVQPGESFHLISKDKYMEMAEYELPGIMSSSLEHLVLSIKMVSPSTEAVELLKEFPSPPRQRDVQQAVRTLKAASLLSINETPTPLASVVMKISSNLPSALALVYSAILRCFNLTVSAVACEETPLILHTLGDSSSQVRTLKASWDQSSDHLAKAKLLSGNETSVQHPSYHQAKALKRFLHKQVASIFKEANLNNQSDEEMVKAVLLNAFGLLSTKIQSKSLHPYLIDRSGVKFRMTSRSVNYRVQDIDCQFFMYLSGTISRGIMHVNDTSVVSPLSVFLFLPSVFEVLNSTEGTTLLSAWHESKVQISLPTEHYEKLEALRKAMKHVIDYFILAEALGQPDENLDAVNEFREILLDCVKDILNSK